jgi:hypothetical protein
MARFLSSTDLAIALAIRSSTLVVETKSGRFGDYVAISDSRGLIEVHLSQAEADARLASIRKALE